MVCGFVLWRKMNSQWKWNVSLKQHAVIRQAVVCLCLIHPASFTRIWRILNIEERFCLNSRIWDMSWNSQFSLSFGKPVIIEEHNYFADVCAWANTKYVRMLLKSKLAYAWADSPLRLKDIKTSHLRNVIRYDPQWLTDY